jgi:hypothetical protein
MLYDLQLEKINGFVKQVESRVMKGEKDAKEQKGKKMSF